MNEKIESYKEELIEKITQMISEDGSLPTFVQVLADRKDEEKPVLVHIDVQFTSKKDKVDFVENGIPMICKKLKGEDLKPICVAFAGEAFMTVVDKNDENEEKKEIVVVNISSEEENSNIIYDLIRHPYEVDANGDLKERVELVIDTDITESLPTKSDSGLFSNLFNKFAEGLKQ